MTTSRLKIKKILISFLDWLSLVNYWINSLKKIWCSRYCLRHLKVQKSIKSFGYFWSSMKSSASCYLEVQARGRRFNLTTIRSRKMNYYKHRKKWPKVKQKHLQCGYATAKLKPFQHRKKRKKREARECRRKRVSFWKCIEHHKAKKRRRNLMMTTNWLQRKKRYNSRWRTEKFSQLMINST